MIKIKSVSKQYAQTTAQEWALKDVSFTIEQGEMIAIVGTSGSGKTTLLNLIGGLDRDFTGEVFVAGKDLSTLSDVELSELRNQSIGFVFQHFNLLDHLSSVDNVMLPLCLSKKRTERNQEILKNPRQRASDLLERLGLGDKLEISPNQLSGGQKQRVAIARALFFNPSLLLCDEPTGSLDSQTGKDIIELFQELNAEGYTVIMITHEDRVSNAARRVIRLEDGKLLSDSSDTQNNSEETSTIINHSPNTQGPLV
jgi:putative ABC transport system ATP-binding protein